MAMTPHEMRPALHLLALALGGVLLAPTPAPAQHRMMVFDDGGGPQVVHFTGPDLRELRRADFERKDLPVFNEKLDLDEMQRLVVGVLLDTYLDAFKTLADETLPKAPSPMLGLGMGEPPAEGADGPPPESLDAIVRKAIEEAGGAHDVDIDVEGQGPIAIQIEATAAFGGEGGEAIDAGDLPHEGLGDEQEVIVWAEGEGDGEGDGVGGEAVVGNAPEAGVFIAVAGPEGVELPPELQEKLAKKAQEMADRIREHLEQIEAEGGPPPDEIMGAGSADERQKYFDDLRESTKKFKKAKAALKRDFINEVKSQLSAEQMELWPALERALTRIKTLPQGRLDGERTNLLQIVEELGLDDEQRQVVADVLAAYELSLHEALVARNAFVDEAQPKIDTAIEQGRFATASATADQAARLRVAVRGVNEQYAETIAGKLEPETGRTFQDRVLRVSYPRVYRTTRAQQAFRGARRIEPLDDEVRSAVEALETAYGAELEAANERLRQTIHRHQPREPRQMIDNIRSMMEGGEPVGLGDEDDPVREATRKRSELDERYMKQLYALLTPEQVETLPKLPSEVQRGPMIIRRSTAPQ